MTRVLDFTKPHVLRSEEEYEAAIARIDELLRIELEPHSDGWEELRFLSLLVEDYEREHYPIEPASPQQIVEYALEQRGLDRSALYDVMGGKSRVSEFLNEKRPLSLSQVRGLRKLLGIPADVLLPEEEA
jgi:HTH-type transcriptional regulator / antitoxin HigA